ncbi:MAG TPA: hypothetical protein P5065_02900 [Candidatus Ratteibacteria bacterium]|jgi:ribonuclease HII|nr:hypothetical protein [bacterium]HOQ81462.1 hypothetical protein [bacterium]HPC29232.1 hypothetical protein [bacterium]HRS05973.1 hypothetical protein [Candidatus Ratteibacteria bacterium]HRV04034.1 hypothetical protein [Candidatus Ratteibacteria bacterium]
MIYVSIDENGYGPTLGPLITTGIAGTSDIDNGWPEDIVDSKKLFSSYKKFATIEKIALSLFKITFKKFPSTALDLFKQSNDIKCPKEQICLNNLPQVPMKTSIDQINSYTEYLYDFLNKQNITIKSIYSQITCVKEFNNLCRKKLRKDYMNYLQFEKIILNYCKTFENIVVSAGKIGGRNYYMDFFQKTFSSWKIKKINESKDISEYTLIKNNSGIVLKFVKNIEDKSFLGVLAGIYGKYIREISMIGINRFLGTNRFISGYRDRYTSEFIKKIQNKNLVYMDCILRVK